MPAAVGEAPGSTLDRRRPSPGGSENTGPTNGDHLEVARAVAWSWHRFCLSQDRTSGYSILGNEIPHRAEPCRTDAPFWRRFLGSRQRDASIATPFSPAGPD